MRKDLLQIDNLKGSKIPEDIFQELLRSFHTLKGLAGMVGARELVNLTHNLENFIKFIYEVRSSAGSTSMDVLFSGAEYVEKLLSAIRDRSQPPDITGILSDIKDLITENEKSLTVKTPGQEISSGETSWKFLFTPSRELFEKGININNVRSLISSIGKVTSSLPGKDQENRITFEFIVQTAEPEGSFSNKLPEGVKYEKFDEKELPGTERTSSPYSGQIQKNVVRVDLKMIDEIINTIGDLVTSRSRLGDQIAGLEPAATGLLETSGIMERQLRVLRESVMKLRLVPVGDAFERLRFAARDLIRDSGKLVKLELKGQETHIDKYIMEKMFDPLLHLVRNAVSHGIETTEQRRQKGKPEEGDITLRAFASGNAVIFEVSDDGSGIDLDKVRDKAIQTGIITPDSTPDNQALFNILYNPGFSTRNESDAVSGRGVGLNVARQTVLELGGNILTDTAPNKGTTFTIQLPLTLSIVDALIIETGKTKFAVPLPFIDEIVSIKRDELVRIGESELVHYRDTVLPLLNLNKYFNLPENTNSIFNALVIGNESDRAGLVIEKILGQREIVVRSLSDPLLKINGIAGATEIGEGRIILILDPHELVRTLYSNKQEQESHA